MALEWRVSDHVEIVVGRSRVECALPARIGYMGGGPTPARDGWPPNGRWFDAWFSILVWTISIEYTQDGFSVDEADADHWLESHKADRSGDDGSAGEDGDQEPLTPVESADGSGLGGGPTIREPDAGL